MAITPLTSAPATSTNLKMSDESSLGTGGIHTEAALQPEAFSKTEADSALFSSRAERLAALNKEFMITGPGFEVSAAFIKRLQELEFISSGEAERLLSQSVSGTDSATKDEGFQAIIDLQQDLQTLALEAPENGRLAKLLSETADALNDLKASTPLANAPQYKSLHKQLEQALASNSDAAALNDTDRRRITQAMDVMLIASRLAPGSETNAGIRSYLANT